MKYKYLSKGYTVIVDSWENDGDYYQTNQVTVETKEEARRLSHICSNLFQSECIGNTTSQEEVIEGLDFYNSFNIYPVTEMEAERIASDLLGRSEYYRYRMCENVTILYTPEDLYVELINFRKDD